MREYVRVMFSILSKLARATMGAALGQALSGYEQLGHSLGL